MERPSSSTVSMARQGASPSMRVLVFSSLYPNNVWSRHGLFVKERTVHFARLDGCSVKVIAPVPYAPSFRLGWRWRFSRVVPWETREGIDVYHPRYFMTPKIGMALYGLTMFLSVLPAVKRIQRMYDFDLIDAHYAFPDGFAAVLLGRLLNKPVVVTAHGSDINLFKEFPVIRRLVQYTLGRADRVIAVSEALKGVMTQWPLSREKIAVIPNAIDPSKFYRVPKEEARRKLGLPTMETRVLLSVGGLTPVKGFDLLMKAVKILREEHQETELCVLIVGEGTSRGELEQLIADLHLEGCVRLVGPIPHDELYWWYSAADLFCLASIREGWPCVLLESLACGTPIVATSVGGVPEVICDDTIGLLTTRSARDMAEKIFSALNTSWDAQKISGYASGQTWDRAARSVSRLFESVLREKDRSLSVSGHV